MRKSLLALFTVAMLVIVALPAVMTADEAKEVPVAEDIRTFTGQISHSGGKPMESPADMIIEIDEIDGGEIVKTGTWEKRLLSDGSFNIEMNYVKGHKYVISFSENGYVVSGKTSCMKFYEDDKDRFEIDLEKATYDSTNKTYHLTSEMEYIQMSTANGNVKGKIVSASGGNPPLNGVRVTLNSIIGNVSHTAFTNGDGTFTFSNIGVGVYKLVAESKGFKTYVLDEEDSYIVVNSGETYKVPEIEMTPDNSINTSHWMTIAGAAAAIILLLATVIHIYRTKKRKNWKSSHE